MFHSASSDKPVYTQSFRPPDWSQGLLPLHEEPLHSFWRIEAKYWAPFTKETINKVAAKGLVKFKGIGD